jgi:L-rhamnose-H+ transport protein
MPVSILGATAPGWTRVLAAAPAGALAAALGFGFAWGFGAIAFGRSVDALGVAIANSVVIGLSSALGSLVPLVMGGRVQPTPRILTLFAGVAAFLAGVALCGAAGLARDRASAGRASAPAPLKGYFFAVAAGVMSAVFNIGFTLALPISRSGVSAGLSQFAATNCIWLLMLGAGAIPNLAFCGWLMRRNRTAKLLAGPSSVRGWMIAVVMGLLWGGSIFLYGAAVPRLGDIGPSIGWPLSLAVGLAVANLMGILLGEWRSAGAGAIGKMRWGLAVLAAAILLCAFSTRMS